MQSAELFSLIDWFFTTDSVPVPFELRPGVTVLEGKWFDRIAEQCENVAAGRVEPRALTGALEQDLQDLKRMYK